MNHHILLTVLILVSGASFADTASQTDWSSGDGVPGPVTSWGDSFDNVSSIDWVDTGNLCLSRSSDFPRDIKGSIGIGNYSHSLCILPSGEYLYVSDREDDNVSVIRTSDNTVVKTINVGEYPGGLCCIESGEYVYVANRNSMDISVIRTSDNTVVSTIDVGSSPSMICSNPPGNYLYVSLYTTDEVCVIRTSDNTVVQTINVGDYPCAPCPLESGEYVYVANRFSGDVTVIRTSDNTVIATIPVGIGLQGICALPSDDYIYVVNQDDDNVSVIQTSNNTVVDVIDVGNLPGHPHSLPSGEYVYVPNRADDNVSVIRTSDNTVVATITAGDRPQGTISTPKGTYVYVLNRDSKDISILGFTYPSQGTLESSILDIELPAGEIVTAASIEAYGMTPDYTDMSFQVRGSDDYLDMGSWSPEISKWGGDISEYLSWDDTYFQYKILLDTDVDTATPVINDVILEWTSASGDIIDVTAPASSTVWTHFETTLPIEWQYPSFLIKDSDSGETISITLFDGASEVATLTSATENDGSWTYSGPVPMEWTPGTEYRVYIEDDFENYGWSDYFSIEASVGQEVITVTSPISSTTWDHYQTGTEVLWEYPAILSGDSVRIEIYDDGDLLGVFGNWTPNDGEFIRNEGIDPLWGIGSKYELKLTDNFGNYGWSERFAISAADIIDVTDPGTGTEWVYYTTDNTVTWNTSGLQSTSVDIVLYKNGSLLETLVTGTNNDGSWTFGDIIPDSWEIGSDYQIKIIDNYEDWGYSEEFSVVESTGADVVEVTEPTVSTVWTHFDIGLSIDWQYPSLLNVEGELSGDLISISLYDGEDLVENLVTDTANDGNWIYAGPVSMDWVPGTSYRIYIEDGLENYGWSVYFEIAPSTGQEIITVTAPTVSTTWEHYQTGTEVLWEYPAILSGDSVRIDIYEDGDLLGVFGSWTPNDGAYIRSEGIDPTWAMSSNYQLKVTDNLGNYGWSAYFTIVTTDVIDITEPDGTTEWMHYSSDNLIEWDAGGLFSHSVDITLYKGGSFITTIATNIDNEGIYTYEDAIPASWAIGSDYQIKILDDLGDWGWSEEFSVSLSSGAEIIEIAEPESSTIWTHFDYDLAVEWQYPTILSGDSVSISLYDDETLVETLTASTPNDGSWRFEEIIPMEWTPGSEYRVYIEDNLENFGWSEYFTVEASSGQEVITVTTPDTWYHYETDTEVLWEYPAILSGDSIKIALYQGAVLLDTYADWTVNDGEYIRAEGIKPAWGDGSDYTLKVYDNYDNHGWSDEFSIEPDEVISITEPTSSTEWMRYSSNHEITWEIEGLLSTSVDIAIYKGGVFIDSLVFGTDNDGSWIMEESIPGDAELGSDYQIHILDNYSDWGFSEEFSVIESSGAEIVEITEPNASTVWTHFDTDLPVEWQYPSLLETLVGDSVSIILYDDETLIDVLTASTLNDGSWRFEEIVPVDWEPGTEYRLYIEDDLTNYGWSEYFEVAASSGQEVITVINPDSSTIWTHFEEDLSIDWEYPAILSGDSVSLSLYDDETLVSLLVESTPNNGSWVYTGPLPMEWTPGVEYRIYIEDNLTNYGWGDYFEIAASSGAEVIVITQPDSLTQWNHLDTNTVVEWEYPALLLTSGSLSGDSVMIELYSEGARISEFAWWTPNTGSYTREEEILETWGTGVEYQIKVTDNLDNWGMSQFFSIQEYGTGVEGGIVGAYNLLPIVPNPTTGSFAIRFSVPEASHTSVNIFDLSGRLVTSVVSQEMVSGTYRSQVSGLPAGVYICRMESGTFEASERVVVIR